MQARHRFIESLQFAQRIAFAEMRVEVVGIAEKHIAIGGQRLFVALRGGERGAKVQTCVDEIGILGEQRLELFDGFVEAALLLQR